MLKSARSQFILLIYVTSEFTNKVYTRIRNSIDELIRRKNQNYCNTKILKFDHYPHFQWVPLLAKPSLKYQVKLGPEPNYTWLFKSVLPIHGSSPDYDSEVWTTALLSPSVYFWAFTSHADTTTHTSLTFAVDTFTPSNSLAGWTRVIHCPFATEQSISPTIDLFFDDHIWAWLTFSSLIGFWIGFTSFFLNAFEIFSVSIIQFQ